jgi:rhodanese-related sulfurtransferase
MECVFPIDKLLAKEQLDAEELESLLKAREEAQADFLLVDVREEAEYDCEHIKGVDMLKPASAFPEWAEAFSREYRETAVVFTCRTGNRSGELQRLCKANGMACVINHAGGITAFCGETIKADTVKKENMAEHATTNEERLKYAE